jgi:hypothetical protein
MDGDPPINLNDSQRKAMATMIGQRISLIQGVGGKDVFMLLLTETPIPYSPQGPVKRKLLLKRSRF